MLNFHYMRFWFYSHPFVYFSCKYLITLFLLNAVFYWFYSSNLISLFFFSGFREVVNYEVE